MLPIPSPGYSQDCYHPRILQQVRPRDTSLQELQLLQRYYPHDVPENYWGSRRQTYGYDLRTSGRKEDDSICWWHQHADYQWVGRSGNFMINSLSLRGAVVGLLECLTVVGKVAGSSPAWAERLSLTIQQWMGTWLASGKVKGGKRRGLGPPFTCRAQDTRSSNTPLLWQPFLPLSSWLLLWKLRLFKPVHFRCHEFMKIFALSFWKPVLMSFIALILVEKGKKW